MLIGVKETPALARRVSLVEVSGVPVIGVVTAMLGADGWTISCAQRLAHPAHGRAWKRNDLGQPFAEVRNGFVRAFTLVGRHHVEITPKLIRDGEIIEEWLQEIEARANGRWPL